jgi:hypothetical protein
VRALAIAVLVALGGLLAVAAPAPAAHHPAKKKHAPKPAPLETGGSRLALGFTDDFSFELSSPAAEAGWLSRARSIGSGYVRITAYWSDIAPVSRPRGFNGANAADRHYNWAQLDEAVREATAHGQSVVLMAISAPRWAEPRSIPAGVRAGIWFPSTAAFRAFGHALAERYSGRFRDPLDRRRRLPRVRYFQAWNEPNLPNYLLPQWEQVHGTWQPISPTIYRGLLNAFYAGVKAVQPTSTVLSAGTGPYGDPPAAREGRMRPVTFLKSLFCLTPSLGPAPCSNPPHLDALDHHPYSIAPTVPARNGGDISVPDLDKIWAIVHRAQRYGHVVPGGPKSLWVTEIDWTSGGNGSSPERQAAYLPAALYEFWREDVSHVLWYEVADPPPQQTNSFATAGVYYSNGQPKLAAASYRFPFAAVPVKQHRMAIWGRAPTRGRVSIQKLVGSTWEQIASLRTSSGGIFYALRPVVHGIQLRAVIGGDVSPTYVTS